MGIKTHLPEVAAGLPGDAPRLAARLSPGTKAPAAPGDFDRRLKEACRELEGLLWYQVLKAMRRTVPEGGFVGGGPGEQVFRDMYDQQLAEGMASASDSGLAELLYRQMNPRGGKPGPRVQ